MHTRGSYTHPGAVVSQLSPGDVEGARVMLINMPLRESAPPNVAPLGPALLAARLRQFGAIPVIVDLNAYRLPTSDLRLTTHEQFDPVGQPLAYAKSPGAGRHLSLAEAEALIAKYLDRHGDQDLIAFSGLITTLRWQENLARVIRSIQPRAILATGNGLATEFREDLFRWIPELNAVCHSEGDDAILKMAYDAKLIRAVGVKAAVLSGKLEPYFMECTADGQPRFAYHGGRPDDLDSLPFPAWDLMEEDVDGVRVLETYLRNPIWGGGSRNSSAAPFSMARSLSTVSSRGCPFDCKFCFRGAQGERNYGVRSAENLAQEIALFSEKYKLDFMGITDDNFMVVPRRIQNLVPAMQDVLERTGVRWGTHGRLDEAADIRPNPARNGHGGPVYVRNAISRVDLMAKAGCAYIGFGAESASPRILEAMGKGGFILSNGTQRWQGHEFPVTMMEGVKRTREAGIHGNCTWIMGYPGETLEDLKNTVAFIQWQEEFYTAGAATDSPEHYAARRAVNKSMFTATAYPGTEMFGDPDVKRVLQEEFGVQFDPESGRPVPNESLHEYVLQLDDATKVLFNRDGRPLNYSAMPPEVFMEARSYVDRGEIFRILEM
ncbi:MAG: radical SAM protein [Nitrospirae bacterium]|nr:radical SAM protein [Nitrospirota bacterium]